VHDPRADFNFREHGARVLSLDGGPRTEDRPAGRASGGEGSPEMESQATNYGEVGTGGGSGGERLRGTRGVIRFLANYSRVPLTSPICLDYPDGPSEPRDLKARSPPAAASSRSFLRSPFAPVTSAHAKKRARPAGQIDIR